MEGFLRVNSAPSGLVSLVEAKAQTRVDAGADDALLSDYILAATAAIDGPLAMAGRAFGAQTWDYILPAFYGRIVVPVPGASAVSSSSYYDTDDASQSITLSDYYRVIIRDNGLLLERKDGIATPETYTRTDAVTITVTAGGDVPEHIKHAALLTIANWYEAREMGDVPEAAKTLVNLDRNGWFGG